MTKYKFIVAFLFLIIFSDSAVAKDQQKSLILGAASLGDESTLKMAIKLENDVR